MADERGQVTNTGDGGVDPFSDEGLGLAQEEANDPVQSSPTSEGENEPKADFGGLPFQSVEEFVKGHKSLQEAYRKSQTDLYEIRSYLQQVAPLIARMNEAPAAKEEDPDIPAFLDGFLKTGPRAIEQVAGKTIDSRWKEYERGKIAPLQEKIDRFERELEVNKFMGDHPEITAEDEDALLEVIHGTPALKSMPGSVYEKLDIALALLVKKEPTRFVSRQGAARQAGAAGINSMKQAASSIGTKAGTKARVAKDEFDEVLDLDAKRWRGIS